MPHHPRFRRLSIEDAFAGQLKPQRVDPFAMNDAQPAYPASTGKPASARKKIYCDSIPAFIGPWRGKTRVWHQPEPRPRAHDEFTLKPSHATKLDTESARTDRRSERNLWCLRVALRRERQSGRSGASGYSIERHRALRDALERALQAANSAAVRRTFH